MVVVLGFRSDQVLERVGFGRAEPVLCPGWSQGQSASVRCGVAALAGAAKVIVTLGDEPLITPAAIARFVSEPGGARALYHGRPGHPVVLRPAQLSAVASLDGDRRARKLVRGALIECSELCSGADVDTPGDLEAIRSEARAVL